MPPECIYPIGTRDLALVAHDLCEHRDVQENKDRFTCLKMISHHRVSHNIKGRRSFASDWQTLIRLKAGLTGSTLHKSRIKD